MGLFLHMDIINKIAIIGLGYVGFPLAKSFSKFYPTVGYDIDIDLVDSLNKKNIKTLLYLMIVISLKMLMFLLLLYLLQ